MRLEDYRVEAPRRLRETLAELFDLRPDEVRIEPGKGPGPGGVDLVLTTSIGTVLAAELKGSAKKLDVERAARQARIAAAELGAIPLVVVPYMGPTGRQAAEAEEVNWIDLSGNASIQAANLRVHVEGLPNLYAQRGRPSSPFAPVSSRVTRLMLLDPERWWRQADLADVAAMRPGQVSKAIGRLYELELVQRGDDRAVRPRDPNQLLDAWAEDYDVNRHHAVYAHVTGEGEKLARQVARRLDRAGFRHALTGLPAAWLRDRFAQFRLASVFVEGDPVAAAESLGARLESRGANLQIILPNDPGVFTGVERVDGVHCVAAVQNYLDLLGLPERADEAAEHLRAEELRWGRLGA